MNIYQTSKELNKWGNNNKQIASLSSDLLMKAKKQGFSDFQIARAIGFDGDMEEGILSVRNYRKSYLKSENPCFLAFIRRSDERDAICLLLFPHLFNSFEV
jgi:hypothetical protein